MRLYLLFTIFAVLITAVFAWQKEDYEIFDLVSSLETAEGKGTTFYSWLDVPSTASTSEIAKAYRKLSMKMHPDKNPGVKGAHERFARLGVIANILRNKESRKRYDFFYKNGVPKWRGTGYYYSRFRPGLGTVLVFLIFFTSALQLVIQKMNYKKDLARIDLITSRARHAAWGPKMIPIPGQRKVRVNLGEQRDEDGFVEGTKTIEMVVEGENVYILDGDGTLHPIDNSTATRPSVGNTWFITLMKDLFRKAIPKKEKPEEIVEPYDVDTDSDDASSTATSEATRSGTNTPKEDTGKGGSLNSRLMPVEKAGGKRRKVNKRR
ncbi:DnaJ-domain-containing protein [Macrolepiota fuliginosa MF-IS2]|uniref:DnaJ-domain-containing protein n=1 Tax=Macrolepiota fuliginosa MF-IS2 TaxID=1400762 RepID=A0A9P6C0T7_9AGAR|nr:DnaJ-domain-containing protein [Macrolepiota fuliginosa MF-IS2]